MIGGDPYELRIVVPTGAASWNAERAELVDAPAGAVVEVLQNGPMIRARIDSPAKAAVAWRIYFERSAVSPPAERPPRGFRAAFEAEQVRLAWERSETSGYRILRDGSLLAETLDTGHVDPHAGRGEDHVYTIQARNWDGSWSAPNEARIRIPEAVPHPSIEDAPSAPEVYLAELKPVKATVGWGRFGINTSVSGGPLSMNGLSFANGLGVHAMSTVIYAIPEGASRFVATAGLDDAKRDDPRSSVVCKVKGDVKEMGEPAVVLAVSPLLKGENRMWHVDVELDPRFRELQLVVEDGGDGIAADHVNWVNPGFIR